MRAASLGINIVLVAMSNHIHVGKRTVVLLLERAVALINVHLTRGRSSRDTDLAT